MTNQSSVVEEYIWFFKNLIPGSYEILEDVFSKGYCYQFAVMLKDRFDGEILYEPVIGHFVTKIDGEYWDISGNVTNDFSDKCLYTKERYLELKNVQKGCILKFDPENFEDT